MKIEGQALFNYGMPPIVFYKTDAEFHGILNRLKTIVLFTFYIC